MKTITFYSYKGGAGRSLALANAARYLARLEFKVVVLDFDLEAPGLHYKFSTSEGGKALPVQAGVVDYLHSFVVDGELPSSIKPFAINVAVPGVEKPLMQLVPAGNVPSAGYWSKLARINWHELFYAKGAKGVQVFLELKNRIADELNPDFLLVDSRTGITEMGGVATALLADMTICLVLPTPENLEGARAVLRSLRKSRRESGGGGLDLMVAVTRLPEMNDSEAERSLTDSIRTFMNKEAEDLQDTLAISEVFVLHSEPQLQVHESLRVGSGVSPDDSVLLRDYLRLFANVVPNEQIEPMIGKLVEQAKLKLWENPEAAVKEVEELAESFGHPQTYRELLKFYEVRNASGARVLKRAQRLWELTGHSDEQLLWHVVRKNFQHTPPWERQSEWSPNSDFIESVWREAGKREPEFGSAIAESYAMEDKESRAADILLEVIKSSGPTPESASRCIDLLDAANRVAEAENLVQELKPKFMGAPEFMEAWVRHALRTKSKESLVELTQQPTLDILKKSRPALAVRVLQRAGMQREAIVLVEQLLRGLAGKVEELDHEKLFEIGSVANETGRWPLFEQVMRGQVQPSLLEEIKARVQRPHRTR